MLTTTIGLFDSFSQVIRAAQVLQGCGFGRDEISVLGPKREPDAIGNDGPQGSKQRLDKRKLSLPADLASFINDAQSVCVDGIGWVAIGGPLAIILTEATDVALPYDLIETLLVFDIPDEEAEYYAEGVRRGGYLLAVTAADHLAERAEDVLLLHRAVDLHQRALRWQREGWVRFDPDGALYTLQDLEQERRRQAQEHKPGKDWHPFDTDFRSHYYLTYTDGDLPYECYALAYRYGFQAASDTRYAKKNWEEIELQIQRTWEQQHDKDWGTIRDAVSYGFLKGRESHSYPTRC